LQYGGAEIRLGSPLLELGFSGTDSKSRVNSLDFESGRVTLGANDAVVLAAPPYVAQQLVPALSAPSEFRAILSAHFAIDSPLAIDHQPEPMTLLLNGTSQWLFATDNRLSVTVYNAGHLADTPREKLAQSLWEEVARAARLPVERLPSWQIITEKRATFAAVPSQENLRPASRTQWPNLTLAGDWTATGLPPCIEGAIQSGQHAADLLMNPQVERR